MSIIFEPHERIRAGAGVKTSVKLNDSNFIELRDEPATAHNSKYTLHEMINLYDVLPQLSFDVEDILKIIYGIDNSNVEMAELVDYFNR